MSWSLKTILNVINAAWDLKLEARLLPEDINDRACDRRTVRVYVKSFDIPVCEHQDGMDIDEIKRMILNPVIEHLKKEEGKIKMTREEAEKKVSKACGVPLGTVNIIDALEALGLIKFNKPVLSPSMIIKNHFNIYDNPMEKADRVVNDLIKNGYKIVKIDA